MSSAPIPTAEDFATTYRDETTAARNWYDDPFPTETLLDRVTLLRRLVEVYGTTRFGGDLMWSTESAVTAAIFKDAAPPADATPRPARL